MGETPLGKRAQSEGQYETYWIPAGRPLKAHAGGGEF